MTGEQGSGPPAGGAPGGEPDLGALADAFRAALDAPDVRGARQLIASAASDGASPARLYVDVVRPALAGLQDSGRGVRARVATGIGEAILANLVASLPLAAPNGVGRAAVLSCREVGIEAVDGSVAIDFLEADGWRVDRLRGDPALAGASEAARAGGIELAVAVTAGPEDAMRLAPVCTALRRVADPPVILLCDFSGRRPRAATVSLGADAVAHDPQELLRQAAERLPTPGQRRWGVGLHREGSTLLLTPTGRLDAISVGRLMDVALTRAGSYTRLVLDLRDVAEFDAGGVRRLASWPGLPQLSEVHIGITADDQLRRRMDEMSPGFSRAIAAV